MRTRTLTVLAVMTAIAMGGCKSSKSASPLSPSVAGPIPGVSITAPKPVVPNAGATIEVSAQPVTLVAENASTTGARPLNYLFEVALDADFTNKVLSREGIEPGDGKTSFKLPDPLAAERTYYWRARAQDGANAGPFSSGVPFNVVTPVVLQAPQLSAPINDVTLDTRTPTFRVANAARSGPVGAIVYEFHVATNESFSQMVATFEQSEQAGATQQGFPGTLNYATRYFWRARAWEMTKNQPGPWSGTAAFRTPAAPTPTPTPTPNPGTPGGCPGNGPDLVNCIAGRYPSYLAAGVSSSQRRANMEFLRDRIIDAGICAGMELAWNLKRGGPEISADYLTYKKGGRWIGVDIGAAYDDTSIPLRLQWAENPDDPYATYGGYSPMPSCK